MLNIVVSGSQDAQVIRDVVTQIIDKKEFSLDESLEPDFLVVTDQIDKPKLLELLYRTKIKVIANFSDPNLNVTLTEFQKNKDKDNHPEIIDYSKSVINFKLKPHINKQVAAATIQLGLSLNIDPSQVIQELTS